MCILDKFTRYGYYCWIPAFAGMTRVCAGMTKLLLLCIFLALFAFKANASDNASNIGDHEIDATHQQRTLRGGWYYFEPFQYQVEKDGVKTMTGLDYELMKAFSRDAHFKTDYQHFLWNEVLENLREGKLDFATGAVYTKERAEYAYYSIPYRYTEAALFLPSNRANDLSYNSNAELLNELKKKKFKIAVVSGFAYSDPLITAFVNNPENKDIVVKTNSDYTSLDLLLTGEVSGFFADRIVGTTLIWHIHPPLQIIERRLEVNSPIHILFSKKTVSPEIVERYNQSIMKVTNSNEYNNIVSWYLYPAIVFQIRDAPWFRMTEIIGTIAFAISGLIIAFRDKATLFGAFVLALLPSLGGGLMRDVILDRIPVGALQSPIYFTTVLITVAVGYIIVKILDHFKRNHPVPQEIEDIFHRHAIIILTITDAIGLATFTVIGVMVSLLAKANPLWLWGPFFAFMTGAGGGILRDIVSKTRYIEALEGEFYGELAIIWGFLLSIFLLTSTHQSQPEYIEYAVIFTILGVFISRIIVHYWQLPNIRFKKF